MSADRIAQSDVARQRNHRDSATRDRGLHRDFQNARHLFRMRNQFTIVAALGEKMFRMRFLKIAAADFLTWNLRGDGENGNAAAVAVVKPVDQMQIAGPTTSRTDCEASGQVRF